ncbi:MAG: hypothetical protein AAB408_00550 [Patescibacteria group bacterium]
MWQLSGKTAVFPTTRRGKVASTPRIGGQAMNNDVNAGFAL